MVTHLDSEHLSSFEVRFSPHPDALGRALEQNRIVPGTCLQLRFGGQTAGFPIADLWNTCCELTLQAQLVREGVLEHFVIDAEQVFEISYAGDLLFCIFSQEHVFCTDRVEFAKALEHIVDHIFAATTHPRLMGVAAGWGAASIRALPYLSRFSSSALL